MSVVLLRRRKLGKGSTLGIKSFSQTGIDVVRNWIDRFPDDTELVFRWGCTSDVPDGVQVVNKAQNIHWVNDKRGSRLALQEAGVSVPQTWCTEDFPGGDDFAIEEQFVSRPARHAQGRNLSYGNYMTVHRYPGGYISRKIDKVAEYRVFVCQGRAVWVAKKTPGNHDDVAWNVAQGGRFDNVRWGEWPLRVVKEAIKAHAVNGLDFSGVDVMVDAGGTPYVLELNSAPSQTSPYRQSCVAKAFDWIVRNGKAVIPLSEQRGGWQKFIHPSLSEEAWV